MPILWSKIIKEFAAANLEDAYLALIEGKIYNARINQLKDRGRAVFASKFIKGGEPILTDAPVVNVADNEGDPFSDVECCNQCLRVIVTQDKFIEDLIESHQPPFLPSYWVSNSTSTFCPYCHDVIYCSEQCQQQSWNQHHSNLCWHVRKKRYSTQSNITDPLPNILQQFDSVMPKNYQKMFLRWISQLKSILPSNITTDHIMEDEQLKTAVLDWWQPIGRLHTLSIKEIESYSNNNNESYNFGSSSELWNQLAKELADIIDSPILSELITKDFLKQFCWTLRLNSVAIVPFTVIDQYYKRMYKDNNTSSTNYSSSTISWKYTISGVGLYPCTSFLNHSCCDANARITTHFTNHCHSVIATRDIAEGEEILISYLDVPSNLKFNLLNDDPVAKEELEELHNQLKKRYLFDCTCFNNKP